ncbi:MAG: glutamate-5-semialdehyde dehydrogenase [Clostridia bacterium]|jgi:glutamate-5-semialdehyde dehydrogenase|nr:glutamate-5-semialdehyde dehydrogenase [Clostridia bacterium]
MEDMQQACGKVRNATYKLSLYDTKTKNEILLAIADKILASKQEIKAVNAIDIQNAKGKLSEAMIDRLTLTDARIELMAEGVRQVAELDDPVGKVVRQWTVESGLEIKKVRAPLGVIGVIYESRPNVTVDVASLCIKSGNGVILKGGKEAINSNRALFEIIQKAIEELGYDKDIVGFVDNVERSATYEMLQQAKYIDVIIPRGSDNLKKFVLTNSQIPVIASSGGNCHVYVEKTADLAMAKDIVYNAKMQRVSVCNAAEQLLVDRDIAEKFLPDMIDTLQKGGCKVIGDETVCKLCKDVIPAKEEDYKTEREDYILTVKVVKDYKEAIDRINANGTKHSEAIISKDAEAMRVFTTAVDAGCVYTNASTRFTDGFEFGFGAEIGISTQKLHARGPLGLEQLTSEKYVVTGHGEVRK